MTIEDEIRRLTPSQRRALDNIAIGLSPYASKRTCDALRTRGLVIGTPHQDGVFHWTEYHVPIRVHYAWAQVGAAEFDALSPEEQAKMEAPDEP